MPRLTNAQLAHLTSRITNIINAMQNQQVTALGPEPELIAFTQEEQLALIKKGKATLAKEIVHGYNTHVTAYFTYPQTPRMRAARVTNERWKQQVKAIREKFEKERTKLMDQAVLGDSSEAMEMLQALEAKLKSQ